MDNKKTAKWIFTRLKKFIPAVIIISLMSTFVSLGGIALILITRQILNDAQAGITGAELRVNIIWLIVVLIAQIAINLVDGFIKNKTIFKMDIHLKDRIFREIIAKDYSKISKLHSGELVTRLSSDVDVIVRGMASIIPSVISTVAKLIAGVSVFMALDPLVAIIIIVIGFLFPLIGRIISKKYKHLHKKAQETEGAVRSFLQESIQNVIVIKTFSANNPVRQKLLGYLNENLKVKMKRTWLSLFMHTGLYGSFTLGYYGVLIWGALQIAAGTLAYGTFFAFLELVGILRNPLQSISGILPQYYSTLASAERLIELESIENEPIDTEIDVKNMYENMLFIEAKGLTFSYDKEPVINRSDLTINKGSICALMGESGTGKSTLFRLLLGLYKPSDGELFIKTKDGEIPLDSTMRRLFSYVPQGDMILSGSIRENITFLSGDVTEEMLENAAKQAVIYDFIKSLPDGFDTKIGERGLGLSEGQLQRIAIARALLNDAPILLLDECTSALDIETELKLLENLKENRDKTVILITHRRAALDICDTVLTLKKGKIKHS
ncbi:MAG: ABC transporter ATP-binding protein [Acutalibacteraceae bacterium]|nr:ABC transporter ATP-binding protein [Acutalibacteraceae bacterium]